MSQLLEKAYYEEETNQDFLLPLPLPVFCYCVLVLVMQ